jgi:MprA protease rhombosortase-interaction domain-containing protein
MWIIAIIWALSLLAAGVAGYTLRKPISAKKEEIKKEIIDSIGKV